MELRTARAAAALLEAAVLVACTPAPSFHVADGSPAVCADKAGAVAASARNGRSSARPHAADGSGDPLPAAAPRGLDAFMPVPPDNPLTPTKTALGRRLFFDPILSRDGTVSCASCHRPERAFADSVRNSPGVDGKLVARNASALVNRGYGRSFFWDGRAGSLEEAVLLPIENPGELDLPLDSLLARLRDDDAYVLLFQEGFDGLEGPAVTRANLARALATYVRTLRFGDSPADRFAAGDTAALSAAAHRGRRIFFGKGNCGACHAGPTLTDERFHNTGVGWPADAGHYGVTGEQTDSGSFRTPTLREVGRTLPYMHDGSIPTLDSVVAFYAAGGGANPYLDGEIRELELSTLEKRDLVAFLESLASCS